MQDSAIILKDLFERWQQGATTNAEDRQLAQMLSDSRAEQDLSPALKAIWEAARPDEHFSSVADMHAMANQILSDYPVSGDDQVAIPAHRVHFLRTAWFRYAAAVFVLFGIGAYLWKSGNEQKQMQVKYADIAPGHQGAILTLADGKQVLLDSLGNGMVALQNGTEVSLKDGRLAYNQTKANAVSYNTMTTPRGRQFSIMLPDGSKAWLNAASSITFPTAFTGTDRSVKISGEVYFEIIKDLKKPFKVKVNDDNEIQVLGTAFNVNAYAEDPLISTTLLEGAVRLNAFKQLQTLKPGQQGQVDINGKLTLVNNANITKIVAWKNGLFNFQDESLEEVMKQLERWYDIRVRYNGNPPKGKFFGEVQRELTLLQVIETLREIGIQVKLEGRTLIVMS